MSRLAQRGTMVPRQIQMEDQLERGDGVEKGSAKDLNAPRKAAAKATLALSTCKSSSICLDFTY